MADGIVQRDFFISFNSADLAYAEAIDAALIAEGFTTYFHPRDLGPGGNVPLWMDQALLNSTQTLGLFSPDYIKDNAVYSLAERYATWWQDARGDERKLIPIVLREVTFTPLMAVLSRIEVKSLAPKDAAAQVAKRLKGKEETKERDKAQIGSGLPAIFSVAHRPNPNFTGRFEALDALQKSLRAGNAAITAVAGMGGVGKTTLAAEYCHRFGGRYGGVWWIRAEQESTMLADLQALGQRLGVAVGQNIEADARAALDHLASRGEPWLMVYDNAPNADAVRKWLPVGAVRCIITSRRRSDFDDLATVTPLDQWPDDETANYLLARTGRDDATGAARLARALGGLPLAAEQAAAFLKFRKGIRFDDYAKEIARLIKENKPSGDYPDTVHAAFVKSLDARGEIEGGDIGLDILRLCAFLSPDGVDLGLLAIEGGDAVLPAAFAAAMADRFAREDALAALESLSLLRQEDGPMGSVLIFHRLLLEVVRDWMGEEGRAAWGSAAVRLVSGGFPYAALDPQNWPLCARLMPHVAPLEEFAPPTDAAGKALDLLLNQACVYLSARGDREGALALAEKSVALVRKTRADEPLELAAGLSNLGGRYIDLERLDEAEAAYRAALAIEEPLLDANDPSLAITLSNLALVHQERKAFAEAEALYFRAAEIMKAARGTESPEYGTSLSNLGALYGDWADTPGETRRRTQEADFNTRALSVTRAARGERHPATATLYNNLAVMKAKRDEWQAAAVNTERAVAIMLSLDLAQHPNTENSAGWLARWWDQSGQADKAARLRDGDLSDLQPVIARIETEHRDWVAKEPGMRRFGPPSFFELKNEEHAKQVLSAFAHAGVDVDDLMRRLEASELSADDLARIIAEQIARKADTGSAAEC